MASAAGRLPMRRLKFGVTYFQRSNTSSSGRAAWAP